MIELPEKITIDHIEFVLRVEKFSEGWIRALYRPFGTKTGNPPLVTDGKSLFLLSSVGNTEDEAKDDLYKRLELCRKKYKDIDKALK